jgi:hypothetical protein
MSIVHTIVSGQLRYADCAVNAGGVEIPVSFSKDYPRQNRIHVTNHICFDQRCVLLLTPPQFYEFATAFRGAPKDRATDLAETFFIGGAKEVHIVSGRLPIPKPLLKYLGAYKCQPRHATLCWLPVMHTHDFEHLPGTERVLMMHLPTRTTFEIVYEPDHAMLGGLTIFGFAARIHQASDTTPETAEQLQALGQQAIVAFLCDERVVSRWG